MRGGGTRECCLGRGEDEEDDGEGLDYVRGHDLVAEAFVVLGEVATEDGGSPGEDDIRDIIHHDAAGSLMDLHISQLCFERWKGGTYKKHILDRNQNQRLKSPPSNTLK